MRFGIAGAGFSGAVIARQLAEAGHDAIVFETRDHVAGNCHTERDAETGVMVHRYGPHIFHTADERVWSYVNRFGVMVPYDHRVRTTVGGRVYSLPVNLMTINQLFGTALGPDDARTFIAAQADSSIGEPRNFEEQALKFMGRDLYEAFFLGYTRKQWGLAPTEIPASVLKRLPLRFSYEDSYFNHPHQAIPRDGYTAVVEAVLDHPRIEVRLSTPYTEADRGDVDHSVWSGPLDAWFGFAHGRLGYRTLDFEEIRADGDHLGCAVMNYGDLEVPHTRIAEHKHFAPWEHHAQTVCFRETSRLAEEGDTPYYPIRLAEDKSLLRSYVDAARAERGVTFVGRLGTYRYLDMDVTIGEALAAADGILAAVEAGRAVPSLFVDA
ncbi:UDP-galactopyranose/dTDP-fucopyranose mutase family protein [Microlunatus flavus]|uniref:UDP-galactopyranose mutase n=1 Tax=Microlunatus flavus TaxID=1036181 RepID=A0A1H8Z3A4_9ACTN|nr:UDP-galactopyranose mutase [Microlunatus flavus]SEP58924.1 UDP-galactopyranose mutase [Microlunatus flavus]